MNPTTNNGVTTTNTGATTSVVGTNVPQTFTFDQINGTTPLNTPVAPAPTNLLAGLGQTTQNDANQTNQQQAKEQNTYVDLLTSLGSQTADTQALQDQQGITTMQKDLLGLQNIAKQQQAQYNAGIVQAEAARNTRQETNVVQQNLTRQHGIDALLTNSLIAAKQGDITFANSLVDRAIAAKYEPIKARLEAQKFILDQVSGRAAENRKVALDVKMKEIEKAENNEKNLQNMLITASSQGAPVDLVSRAQKAKTPSEAAMILGQYAGDFYKTELLKQQIATEKAQRSKIYADINAKAQALTGQVFDASSLQNATKNLKLTESQSKALAFGQRAVNADKAMRERLQTYDPTTIFSATGRLLRTDNARAFERDLGDFITAVLRKESGATITPDEFERFIPLYSPQGILTNQKDVEQTNVKRNAAIDAIISEAGPASAVLTAYKSTVGKINTNTDSNPFGQALGQSNQTIPGTSIVDKVSDDGSIMFTIPK